MPPGADRKNNFPFGQGPVRITYRTSVVDIFCAKVYEDISFDKHFILSKIINIENSQM